VDHQLQQLFGLGLEIKGFFMGFNGHGFNNAPWLSVFSLLVVYNGVCGTDIKASELATFIFYINNLTLNRQDRIIICQDFRQTGQHRYAENVVVENH